jgi:hypothetical protein
MGDVGSEVEARIVTGQARVKCRSCRSTVHRAAVWRGIYEYYRVPESWIEVTVREGVSRTTEVTMEI